MDKTKKGEAYCAELSQELLNIATDFWQRSEDRKAEIIRSAASFIKHNLVPIAISDTELADQISSMDELIAEQQQNLIALEKANKALTDKIRAMELESDFEVERFHKREGY